MKNTSRASVGLAAAVVVLASAVAVAMVATDTEVAQQASSAVPSSSTASASTSSSTSAAASTTMAERELSPAWVGAQEEIERWQAPFGMEGLAQHRLSADYVRSNPNQWTTPMGALCWADFEIYRAIVMSNEREELDDVWMPQVIALLGIESQVGSDPGPKTTRAVIAILEGYTTSTTVAGSSGPEYDAAELNEAITLFKLFDYWGGEGTELFDALDVVASPEWAAAVRAGDGLSADVLVYADDLAAAARKLLASDHLRLTGYEFGSHLPGYWAFVELAKYDQNCLRAMIHDRPPPLPDIADLSTTTTEVGATTTTVRSGSVRVSGAGLNGVLRLGVSGVGVGYSRPGGEGSLTDTTFRYGGVGYEVERLLWWPNGTVRLDVYPDGLHTAVGDDAYLVVTPGQADNPVEYVWDTADARYLGGGADFVWDTTFTPEFGTAYRVELRIGVPGVPENVRLSGASVVWDAGDGPAVAKYHVWIRPATPGPGTDSFFNSSTFGTEAAWDMSGMARYGGDSFVFQVRARNSAGYSPWTEPRTFTTPGATTTTTAV